MTARDRYAPDSLPNEAGCKARTAVRPCMPTYGTQVRLSSGKQLPVPPALDARAFTLHKFRDYYTTPVPLCQEKNAKSPGQKYLFCYSSARRNPSPRLPPIFKNSQNSYVLTHYANPNSTLNASIYLLAISSVLPSAKMRSRGSVPEKRQMTKLPSAKYTLQPSS